jgi:hypothetical protein
MGVNPPLVSLNTTPLIGFNLRITGVCIYLQLRIRVIITQTIQGPLGTEGVLIYKTATGAYVSPPLVQFTNITIKVQCPTESNNEAHMTFDHGGVLQSGITSYSSSGNPLTDSRSCSFMKLIPDINTSPQCTFMSRKPMRPIERGDRGPK